MGIVKFSLRKAAPEFLHFCFIRHPSPQTSMIKSTSFGVKGVLKKASLVEELSKPEKERGSNVGMFLLWEKCFWLAVNQKMNFQEMLGRVTLSTALTVFYLASIAAAMFVDWPFFMQLFCTSAFVQSTCPVGEFPSTTTRSIAFPFKLAIATDSRKP